jgi:sulfite reductase (NADPH) hemoprotein beta-component
MDVVADLTEHYGSGQVRIIGEQDLMLPHVELIDLKTVYAGLAEIGLAPANAGLVGDIAAAPGFDSEQIAAVGGAIETHLPIRNDHSERFLDDYRRVGPAPLKEALHGAEARVA